MFFPVTLTICAAIKYIHIYKLNAFMLLDCVVATSLAVYIDKPVPTCVIPNHCTNVAINCNTDGKEVEWLDPNNNVITTGRLYSKRLLIQLCTNMSYLILCMCSYTLHRTSNNFKSSSNRFWELHV